MNTKFLAFYLPQYHTIPENDKWWGKGFTEWKRVKSAEPLFEGHKQPRIPYKYYDLSNVKTMIDQANLAKNYGIYGFCYYHYWFNGKKLLEKPLEQMLSNTEVDIPFCLAWANEPWTRAWDGNNKEILMPQEYGNESNWEKHFQYLTDYFKDERYIKINNQPVFLIYRTESFTNFDKMLKYWNNRIKEYGFDSIYIIEMLTTYQKKPTCHRSKGVVEFEPMFTISNNNSIKLKIKDIIRKRLVGLVFKPYKTFDYNKVWKKIIARKTKINNKKIYLGAFVDWDNTPRFKDKAAIFKNSGPKNFEYYLKLQTQKSDSEFIFINAWNEWAEGAYLEPDKDNKYGYLKAIKKLSNNNQF